MKARYSIDIDIGNLSYDLTGYFAGYWGWVEPMYLLAEGDSLEELEQDATIITVGQDGQEGPELRYTEAPADLRDRIEPRLIEAYLEAKDRAALESVTGLQAVLRRGLSPTGELTLSTSDASAVLQLLHDLNEAIHHKGEML